MSISMVLSAIVNRYYEPWLSTIVVLTSLKYHADTSLQQKQTSTGEIAGQRWASKTPTDHRNLLKATQCLIGICWGYWFQSDFGPNLWPNQPYDRYVDGWIPNLHTGFQSVWVGILVNYLSPQCADWLGMQPHVPSMCIEPSKPCRLFHWVIESATFKAPSLWSPETVAWNFRIERQGRRRSPTETRISQCW